jgi:hypothetical protein
MASDDSPVNPNAPPPRLSGIQAEHQAVAASGTTVAEGGAGAAAGAGGVAGPESSMSFAPIARARSRSALKFASTARRRKRATRMDGLEAREPHRSR